MVVHARDTIRLAGLVEGLRVALRSTLFGRLNFDLAEVVPLDTPRQIQIDPTNACNFRCAFCPTGDLALLKAAQRPVGMMDMALFQRVVDGMRNFPRKVEVLYLYKDGEPLLHKNIADMIHYARAAGVAKKVGISTNGSAMDAAVADQLIDSGLDLLRISIEHVTNEGYLNITRNFSGYDRIVANVRNIFQQKKRRGSAMKVHVKIVDTGLSLTEKRKFVREFAGICDTWSINDLMGWSNSLDRDFTLGTNPTRGISGVASRRDNRRVCPSPFYSMAVNFNGLVSMCCVDWSIGTVVGDAAKDSLVDIWNGQAAREFRLAHLEGRRESIAACRNCDYIGGYLPSYDLDQIADRLRDLIRIPLDPER